MSGGGSGIGSDGSEWNGDTQSYPGVSWNDDDFNGAAECPTSILEIQDYNDAIQVRNCRLVGLRDLKTGSEHVRDKLAGFLNKLVDWGVAGFRIDAAKHMWPEDLSSIFSWLHNLKTKWFPEG